jgi:basic amino acid/polyamine antiporter, APA family
MRAQAHTRMTDQPDSSARNKGGELVRGLNLAAGIAIVVGTVIGTGVFLKARAMTCNVGAFSTVLVVWIFAGLLSLAGALTYAELGALMPRAGGEFVFMREAYGRRLAFLYGWMRLAIGIPGAQAAKAVAFAIFLNIVTGGALEGRLELASVSIVVIITLINCASVSVGGRLAVAIVALKVAMIAGLAITAFAFGGGDFAHFALAESGGTCEGIAPGARGGLPGFGAAMLGALWAYDGWAYLASVGGELENPSRNVPLTLIGGTLLVMALYLGVNVAYMYVLSPTEIASVPAGSSVATEVARRFLGDTAASVMAAGMLISVVGSLQTGILAGARTPYAMARDGLFFSKLAEVSDKSRVPVNALLAQGAWIIVLTFTGSFDVLTDYVMFGDWIFYGAITASVFIFRRRMPNAERPYRTFGYPIVPALFVLTTLWLLASRVFAAPHDSLIGLGLIALGIPIYALFFREKR